MAIENTYLLGKNITLGCGFDLQAKAPLDSRQTVPAFAGLQALIDGNAAYEGMIVYDEETKKTYQAQMVDGSLAFREFGINEAELKDLIASETTAAMEFKGAATALPENPAKGDMYKVTASFKVGEEDVKVGDSIVYDGEQWFIIPSGDDIEDTWRPVTDVDNDSTLTFAAGNKLDVAVAADGTITYSHEAIDAPTNMNAEGDEQTRTYITQLITDNHGHVIGFKTATENVEDTNTTYTFEGQSDEATSVYFQVTSNEEGASAEVIYLDAYSKNEADGKFVAKETGKSLVSDDEIARLANVDNYNDEEIRGLINAIDNHSHENKDVLDGITGDKVTAWDGAVSKEHTHSFADADVEDAISKKHAHTFADTDVEDAISKKHSHAFVEVELNKIADGDVTKWNDAYAHSQVAHAPADAQANIIESVKVNGTVLEITDKTVDITIPESTKVEASETNGNIKVDGEEVTVYSHPESHTASEISDFATEVAKVKVDEAVKATRDGNGKVIADTYVEKATTLEGYGITDAYTKSNIEALLAWGSF